MDGSRASVTIADVLLVVFIVLKLVGVIHWSWIWVLSPLWISLIIAVVIIVYAKVRYNL